MIRTFVWLLIGLLGAPSLSFAITSGQIDDFENGSVMGWEEGFVSPNPPINVPTGGPTGAGDNYLRNESSGVHGPGGKMVMFNAGQWTGDYLTAGVSSIQMRLANFGPDTLFVRIAFEGSNTRYGSTAAITLLPDSQWRTATFGTQAASLGLISGTTALDTVLSTVIAMRIVSVRGGPRWEGDETAGNLGVDNILAISQTGVGDSAGRGLRGFVIAPNPFATVTVLVYELSAASLTSIDIHDVAGRLIHRVVSGESQPAGVHQAVWDGRNSGGTLVPPGVYLVRLSSSDFVEVRKIVVADE